MINLSQLMPHVLNQTEIHRFPTKARVMGIVAARTWDGETWIQLGISELMRYYDLEGKLRDRDGARYDRRMLQRLAERDRVLVRRGGQGAGRYPDTYRIAGDDLGDLRQWRHIPWSTSAEAAIRSLRAHVARNGSGLGTPGPGQRLFLRTLRPDLAGSPVSVGAGQDDFLVYPGPRVVYPDPNPPGETGRFGVLRPEPSSASTQCLWDTSYPSSPLGEPRGAEGGSKDLSQAGEQLVIALSAAMKTPVYGRDFRRRLDALVADQPPEVVDRLLARAATHAGTNMVYVAVADLEAWASAAPMSSARPRAERWSVSVEWTEPDGSRRLERTGAKLFTSEAEAEAWAAAVAAGEVTLHEDQGDVVVVDVRAVA